MYSPAANLPPISEVIKHASNTEPYLEAVTYMTLGIILI
jgi:hypothetical protein